MLSIDQKLAANTMEPKVLVCAAAGSGKTTCLTERVRFLLEDKKVSPQNLACITFTNMAAEEMKNRLGSTCLGAFIGTIHSFANYILLMNGINTDSIINEEQFDLLFEKIGENFDNLTFPKIEHLLVDEFQDVSDQQYEFMQMLSAENFWAVGDARQAIYGFNGSNMQLFMDLTNDFNTEVYELNECYRCGQEIISFANKQIKKVTNIYRTATVCVRGDVSIVDEDEFSFAAVEATVKEINDYANTAVLCRSNRMVDDICTYLKHSGIPSSTFKKGDKTLEELNIEMEANTVKVLTIHSAKGLEWKNVIVCQEYNAWNDEEKRINYVAATRAKDYLLWLKMPQKKKKKSYQKSVNMYSWG